MRSRWVKSAGLAMVMAVGLTVWAQPQEPSLSPQQQCEVDRYRLQEQVVELRAQLVAVQTQLDRVLLERERQRIEGELPKAEGYRWDWTQGRFVPVAPPR